MRRTRVVCIACGRTARDAGPMSRGSLCADCSIERQRLNAEQISRREGPFYDAWLEARAKGIARALTERAMRS